MNEKEIDLILLSLSKGASSRKKILRHLILKPKNCNQLANDCELEWWSVQKHLKILLREQFIKSTPFGNIKFYKLTSRGKNALNNMLESTKELK